LNRLIDKLSLQLNRSGATHRADSNYCRESTSENGVTALVFFQTWDD